MKFKVREIIEFLNKHKESDNDIVTIDFCYNTDWDRKGSILEKIKMGEPVNTELCNYQLDTLYCEEAKVERFSIEIMLTPDDRVL